MFLVRRGYLGLVGGPKSLWLAEKAAGVAAPNEESVAEAVQILNGFGRRGFGGGEGDGAAFGAAADRAAEMELGIEATSAGKDEAAERF